MPRLNPEVSEGVGMNETKRRRLALIWSAFVGVIAYVTFADGFTADLGDLLGILLMVLGAGLAYVYYANPRGMLDFGE